MQKIVCSFTSDTALNDVLVLVHAFVCRFKKNKNAFQMHNRLFYSTCTHTHTHTHTHTILMSLEFYSSRLTTTLAMSKSG